jgi:uncharacterized phage infection (PIP) family protein YhgE
MTVNYPKQSLKTGDKITQIYLDNIENYLSDSATQINTNDTKITSVQSEITTARNGRTDLNTRFNNIETSVGDLSGAGLTETDLSTAIKNDRASLLEITQQQITNTNNIENIQQQVANITVEIVRW